MKPSQQILQKFAVNPMPTRDWAIERAKILQPQIIALRNDLNDLRINPTISRLYKAGPLAVQAAIALLQSKDAEMDRLCQATPAVMTVLLAESIGDLNEVP